MWAAIGECKSADCRLSSRADRRLRNKRGEGDKGRGAVAAQFAARSALSASARVRSRKDKSRSTPVAGPHRKTQFGSDDALAPYGSAAFLTGGRPAIFLITFLLSLFYQAFIRSLSSALRHCRSS